MMLDWIINNDWDLLLIGSEMIDANLKEEETCRKVLQLPFFLFHVMTFFLLS